MHYFIARHTRYLSWVIIIIIIWFFFLATVDRRGRYLGTSRSRVYHYAFTPSEVHRARSFLQGLCPFISSGPYLQARRPRQIGVAGADRKTRIPAPYPAEKVRSRILWVRPSPRSEKATIASGLPLASPQPSSLLIVSSVRTESTLTADCLLSGSRPQIMRSA